MAGAHRSLITRRFIGKKGEEELEWGGRGREGYWYSEPRRGSHTLSEGQNVNVRSSPLSKRAQMYTGSLPNHSWALAVFYLECRRSFLKSSFSK